MGADQPDPPAAAPAACPIGATTAPSPCPRALPASCRATRPSASNLGSQFYKEANEVYETVKNATPEQVAIARFWSDDPMLSMTPPGHWVSIALQVAERANLSLEDNVDLLARMGVAMSDAFVGCWREKYVYNLIRPVTYIKKVIDPKWEPILNHAALPRISQRPQHGVRRHGCGADGVLRRQLCVRRQDRLA